MYVIQRPGDWYVGPSGYTRNILDALLFECWQVADALCEHSQGESPVSVRDCFKVIRPFRTEVH